MAFTPFYDANILVGRRACPRPENDLTTEQILDELAYHGISGALATHALAVEYDPLIGNSRLSELVADHPQFQACYVVQTHPTGQFPSGDKLLDYLKAGRARAVRLYPKKQSFGLDPFWSRPLLGPLEEAGVPVLLDMEETDLNEVRTVLEAYPRLQLILLRVGYRMDQWLYPLFKHYAGLHIDLSLYPVHRGIESLVDQVGPDRMIFSTGLPVWNAGAAIAHLQYAQIPDQARAKIAGDNLHHLLWPETAPAEEAEPIPSQPRDPVWARAREGQPLNDILVLDPHTHMGPYHNFPIPGNPWAEGMLEVMDEMGVQTAVTAPMIGLGAGVREGNQIAREAVDNHPGSFFAFCTINPNFPESEIRDELRLCFQEDAFRGIKIHPVTHDMPVTSVRYEPVWEIAHEKQLPILIHTWEADPRCHPALLEPIAHRYPEARLILGHSGGTPRGIDEAIAVARNTENTFLDLTKSIIYQGMLEYMVQSVGADRILWGTDLPFICGSGQLGRVAAARLPIEDKKKILGLNAKRLFRL